jgi:hypothetical protein
MAKKGGNPENLITPSSEVARINGAKGGAKSSQTKKERKLLSQIYAEALTRKYEIDGEELEGPDFFQRVLVKVLDRGDSASVSLLKELREGTEGNKVQLSGPDCGPIQVMQAPAKMTLEEWNKSFVNKPAD